MEKVEKKFFVYIAKDGKEFLDENECASYEKLMDNIRYFRINTTPDLTETGLMQKSIAVLVYSDHYSHYEIALNYAIKELGLRILGEGVQGYGFQQHFDISQSTKQEFESYVKGSKVNPNSSMNIPRWDSVHVLSPINIPGIDNMSNFDYVTAWNLPK